MRYFSILAGAITASLALTVQANAFTITHCSIGGSISEPDSVNTPQHLILEYTGELAGSALTPSEDKACEYYGRGLAYHLTGQYDRAIADYSKALGWMSGFGEAHAALGDAYASTDQHQKAQAEYDEAWRLDQNNAEALTEICWQRAIRGDRLELALSACNRAIELQGPATGAWYVRCLVNYRLGQYKASISDCDKPISRVPYTLPALLYVRGLAKIKSGDSAGGNTDIAAAKDAHRRIAEDEAILGITP